jgi:ABC-type nitrate/sulfonate/bicarbonate transport system substrate-binding protein
MTITRSGFVAGTLATLAAAPLVADADLAPLRLIAFPGSDLLPIYAATAKGYFAREGLAPVLTMTPGSVFQFQHLSAGDFDIAVTAIDNLVAYNEGQGEAPLPNPADFTAILGGDSAFLRFYVTPDITTFADLKGKTLAVDAVTTGFAFVLRALLAANGVADGTYALQPLGGTPSRLKAMLAGTVAGSILNAPFDLMGEPHGLRKLGDIDATIGPYQGVVSVVRRPWLQANATSARGYVRAVRAGLAWMFDPANHDEAVALLVANGTAPPIATAMLPVLTDPATGMARTGAIDVAGVRTVLALRTRYGLPHKVLRDPHAYYDADFTA